MHIRLAIPAVLVAMAAAPAAAGVTVTFEQPERCTDAAPDGGRGERARGPALTAFARHLEALGGRWLRPGQELSVAVLDIDLAGRFDPLRTRAAHVRIMDDVAWPRIHLRYALTEAGRTVAAAEETVIDMEYQRRLRTVRPGEPLALEKAMLDDWFRARIVEGKPPPR